MKGVALWFFATGTVAVTLGMIWGIQMSATGNHMLSGAHAHLNLVGWATMALIGLYYHATPAAAETVLARVHYAVALVGLVTLVPGIVQALRQTGETLAKVGSFLTLIAMLIFLVTVAMHARKPA